MTLKQIWKDAKSKQPWAPEVTRETMRIEVEVVRLRSHPEYYLRMDGGRLVLGKGPHPDPATETEVENRQTMPDPIGKLSEWYEDNLKDWDSVEDIEEELGRQSLNPARRK